MYRGLLYQTVCITSILTHSTQIINNDGLTIKTLFLNKILNFFIVLYIKFKKQRTVRIFF